MWQARVLSGPPSLIDAALEAVRHWRYEPTIVDGHPSPVVTLARVGFFPQNKESRQCGAEPPGREPIRVGSNAQQSKLLRKVEPSYPPGLRGRGAIVLQITVNEQGEVYDARLLLGPSMLEKAVLDAICQWQYFPTYLNGIPVPVIATVTVEYNLPVFP